MKRKKRKGLRSLSKTWIEHPAYNEPLTVEKLKEYLIDIYRLK